MTEARFDAQKRTDDLEAKVKSAEAHSIDVTADGERRLREFENELAQKLGELRKLYVGNVQTIGGLCLPVPTEEPSVEDYLC
jgi:hypothetical protein